MRNFFLVLLLANVLVLAWHLWIDPDQRVAPPDSATGTLELFGSTPGSAPSTPGSGSSRTVAAETRGTSPDRCFRMGPLPDSTAAQQATAQLSARGFSVTSEARDGQVWLGHWVQIVGFDSVPAAERALKRLVAAGINDAYLMQDGTQPILSLGVFRERDRADHVADAARALGFNVAVRARYRPVVQQWLLLRPPAGQPLDRSALNLGSDRIVRIEAASCEPEPVAASPGPPLP
ncbi:MAG: SPOR domain-containing protein [Gammaproteobacteria bacterium PRO9]|nr:SPOR domain-containing protein [Gammaproteobacteria bacterium PRO9]